MKILKNVGLAIVILISVLVVIGFIMPSTIVLERSRTIKAPLQMIYDQVNNLHLWEYWSPWHKIDPDMKITYHKNGIGKDASYSWTSEHKSVGNGTLTITDAKAYEYINTTMDFGEQGTGTANFHFTNVPEGIKVTWDMQSDLGKNPFMRLMGIIMKKSISNAYDRGLADIEVRCEYLQKQVWYYVSTQKIPSAKYYSLNTKISSVEEKPEAIKRMFSLLNEKLITKEIKPKGTGFTIIDNQPEKISMECAYIVDNNSLIIKGLTANILEEKQYATLRYKGNETVNAEAIKYLKEWMKTYNYSHTGSYIEMLMVNPNLQQNPDLWTTMLLFPIH